MAERKQFKRRVHKLSAEARCALRGQLDVSTGQGFQAEVECGPVEGRWLVRVSLGALNVIVRELPDGWFQVDTGTRAAGARWRAGTKNINEAIFAAESYIESLRKPKTTEGLAAELAELDADSGININKVEELFPFTKLAEAATADVYRRAIRIVKFLFGGETLIKELGQTALNVGVEARTRGIPALKLGPVKSSTAVETFQNFGTVIAHLQEASVKLAIGVPESTVFVVKNPWTNAHVTLPDKAPDKRREAATERAFTLLMSACERIDADGNHVVLPAPVDHADPSGALRLIVALTYFTGRRIEALLSLCWHDIVEDIHAMRSILRESDFGSVVWAEHWPHGLLDLRSEKDKEGYHWPIPICGDLALEIALYRRRTKRHTGPLFPSPVRPGDRLSYTAVVKGEWAKFRKDGRFSTLNMGRFEKAVFYAIEQLERTGRDREITSIFPMRVRGKDWDRFPEYRQKDVPILRGLERRSKMPVSFPDSVYRWAFLQGHKLHIRRNGHATTLEKIGWSASMSVRTGPTLDTYAAYIGGWRVTVGDARSDRYRAMDPRLLFSCASFEKARDAVKVIEDETARENEASRLAARRHAEALLNTGPRTEAADTRSA